MIRWLKTVKKSRCDKEKLLFYNSHDSISSIFLVWNLKICMSSLLNSGWWDSNGSLAQVNFLLIKWKNCFIVSTFCWLCRSWNVSQISLQSLKEMVKINLIAEKEIGARTSQLGETFNQGRHWPFAICIQNVRVSICWIIKHVDFGLQTFLGMAMCLFCRCASNSKEKSLSFF